MYRGIARYYLEYYFLICYVISKNVNNIKFFRYFKHVITAQSTLVVICLFYSVLTLTPGILNKSTWEKIMKEKAYGYELSSRVTKIINNNSENEKQFILLSEMRFYSFFHPNFISDQYNKFKTNDNKYSINDIKSKNKIDYILFSNNSFNSQYFEKCVVYSKKYKIKFKTAYRNPFNKQNFSYYYLIKPNDYKC